MSETATAGPPAGTAANWLLLGTTYGLVVSGALLLGVAERTPVYALAAIAACAGHALAIGAGGRPLLPPAATALLALGALAFGLLQAHAGRLHITYGLAHFLLLVQLIKLYGPHQERDLRLIQVAAVFEMLVAGIWALNVIYLPLFLSAGILFMANCAVLTMLPEGPSSSHAGGTAAERRKPWRGLGSALWFPALMVFTFTALLFVVLPRLRRFAGGYRAPMPQITAFTENVSLQEVGRMRASQNVALTARFRQADSVDAAQPPPHLLMRGASLPFYEDGQWFGYDAALARVRPEGLAPGTPKELFISQRVYRLEEADGPARTIRQKVTARRRLGRRGFALYRPLRLTGERPGQSLRPTLLEHHLNLVEPLEPGDSYEVVSLVPEFSEQRLRGAGTPTRGGRWAFFWHIPQGIRPVIQDTAAEVQRLYNPGTDYDRAVAVQSYLLAGDRFAYTFELPDFGRKEPIDAFLTETRRGSCEQFSTAMALLLRTWDMPTRLVIGYKGGSYDKEEEQYIFRDSHAHAWVEVYFNDLGWVQFDPTPGAARVEEGPRGGISWLRRVARRVRGALRDAYQSVEASWGMGVIGYDRHHQRELMQGLSSAAKRLARRATGIFSTLWPGLPNVGILQVALLVVGVTVVALGTYLGARWLQHRLARATSRGRPQRTLRFYAKFLAALRRKGLARPPQTTPREWARRAGARLTGAQHNPRVVQGAIDLVTDLYCRARFGGHKLTEAQQRQIRQALEIVARTSKPPSPGAGDDGSI